MQGTWDSRIIGKNGDKIAGAPNDKNNSAMDIRLERMSSGSNEENIEILDEGSRGTNQEIIGLVFDVKKWLRKIGGAQSKLEKACSKS